MGDHGVGLHQRPLNGIRPVQCQAAYSPRDFRYVQPLGHSDSLHAAQIRRHLALYRGVCVSPVRLQMGICDIPATPEFPGQPVYGSPNPVEVPVVIAAPEMIQFNQFIMPYLIDLKAENIVQPSYPLVHKSRTFSASA